MIINSKNLGPSATYNIAVNNANGEYITVLDSDDFIIENTFRKKIKMFEKNQDLKIVYGNGKRYYNNTQKYGNNICDKNFYTTIKLDPKEILQYLQTNFSPFWIPTSIIKRDFFLKYGGFDEEVFQNDWVANIRMFQEIKHKNEYNYIDIPAFGYRIHDKNITHNPKMIQAFSAVIKKYCPLDLQKIAYGNLYFRLSNVGVYTKSGILSSFKYLILSLKYDFQLNRLTGWFIALLTPQKIIDILPTKFKDFIKNSFKI